MRESKATKVKFWIVAVAALLVAAAGLAQLWPVAHTAAVAQSTSLTSAGAQTSGGEAEADYRLAAWLNPSNETAFVGLAQTQIAAGQPNLAVATLKAAGQGSTVARLQVRTLIELGNYADAATQAHNLTGPAATQADLTLAGLVYALTGHPSDVAAVIPRLTSPQAATSVSRANSGKLPLATELYATGLLNSSSALLMSLPPSYERDLLLARILYARHTPAGLAQAAGLLTSAAGINPTGLDARRLLAAVYRDQGNTAAAAQQTALIGQLQAGRP